MNKNILNFLAIALLVVSFLGCGNLSQEKATTITKRTYPRQISINFFTPSLKDRIRINLAGISTRENDIKILAILKSKGLIDYQIDTLSNKQNYRVTVLEKGKPYISINGNVLEVLLIVEQFAQITGIDDGRKFADVTYTTTITPIEYITEKEVKELIPEYTKVTIGHQALLKKDN